MILPAVLGIALGFCILHLVSYSIIKNRILRRQRWDLNICCGQTDGGGINADIVKHGEVPEFVLIKDIYNLPFRDGQFDTVLCSQTIEHVEDPVGFYQELRRVGKSVTLVIPPLWDISAVLNVFEHRWIFLSFRKEHPTLPKYIQLPLSSWVQGHLGQRIKA